MSRKANDEGRGAKPGTPRVKRHAPRARNRCVRGLLLALLLLAAPLAHAQALRVARVQYGGGGDWYGDERALETLFAYTRQHSLLDVPEREDTVTLDDDRLFAYHVLYLVGHGNVAFSDAEARRLRQYLDGGGFLIVNDDYGLDVPIRREMKKVFPDQDFAELPTGHPVFSAHFAFPNGLPKVHEHDGRRPQAFGLTCAEQRLCVFYDYEADLGDGWNPPEVHHDPPEIREAALKMGVNLLAYAALR